jgi:hypothetical protein
MADNLPLGFQPVQGGISNKFEYLIQESARDCKVVVLIDEYDAPIIHFLGTDIDKAHARKSD